MARLEIRLLGPPDVILDGTPVTFARRKALALLARLAAETTPLPRDLLATLLWPEQDQAGARGSLRRALAVLTKDLGHDYFHTARESIGLIDGAACWIDIRQFQTQLAGVPLDAPADRVDTGGLASTLELYRGDFLAGFSLRDAPEFDGWQYRMAEHLRLQAMHALEFLLLNHESRAAFDQALANAQQLLALDPLDERAHRHLIRLYARTGNRSQALRQYEQCVQLLEAELAVPPADATEELLAAVTAGTLGPTTTSTDGVAPSPAAIDEVRSLTALSLCVLLAERDQGAAGRTLQVADFLAAARTLADSMDARIEGLARDGGLFLFGVASSHEDNAERALRLAFDLQRLAHEHGLDIAVGVHTGPAFVPAAALSDDGSPFITGPLAGQATRIQRAAAKGEILTDQSTFRLVRDAYAMQPATDGDETEVMYRAVRPLAQGQKSRGIRGLHAAMVGRAAELAVLQTEFRHAQRGQGRVVFIEGEAGVGKSRLVAELRQTLADPSRPAVDHFWLEGRCLEMTTATGYGPFRACLRTLFDWRFDEATADFAARIAAGLHDLVEAGELQPDEPDKIGPVLGNLLSLEFGNSWDERLRSIEPAQLRYRTINALARFLQALAGARPLILMLEDLHWADELSIDVIVHLLDAIADRRLLLLCIYRPEPDHRGLRLPRIAAHKCPGRGRELHLRALSPDQSRQLVEALLQVESLAPAAKEWILARGQGNPFFIEEVIRALIDADVIARRGDRWTLTSADGIERIINAIPHNVDSLIQARVGRLPPALRRTLEIAAVAGRTVPRPILARLATSSADLDEELRTLEAGNFLYAETAASAPEYTFHHVLTQEAVYRMVPEEQRVDLHRRTAVALEAVFAGKLDDQIERLAYHYARTPDDVKAAHYLLCAGDKARRAYLNRDALQYYEDALQRLARLTDGEVTPELPASIAETWYRFGRVHYALGNVLPFEEAMRRAIAVGTEAGVDPHILARYTFWLCEAIYWQEDSSVRVAKAAKAGLALLEDGERSVETVILQGHCALVAYEHGEMSTFHQIAAWIADVLPALPYCEELSATYDLVTSAAIDRKENRRAYGFAVLQEEKARTIGDLVSVAKALHLQGRSQSLGGDYATGIATQEQAVDLAEGIGESTILLFMLPHLAYDCLVLGRFEQAIAHAARLYHQPEPEEDTPMLNQAVFHRTSGHIHLGMADYEQAIGALTEGLYAASQSRPHGFPLETVYCLARALLSANRNDHAWQRFFELAERTPAYVLRLPYYFELKPFLPAALAGLEAAATNGTAFRYACEQLRAIHTGGTGHFQQWYLEQAEHAATSNVPITVDLAALRQAPWHWCDPAGDCSYALDNELVVRAPDGRDFWLVNDTAPRFVRPVDGDFIIETTCRPADADRPAMGGLLLWHDLRHFVRLDRGACGRHEITFLGSVDGQDAIFGRGQLPADRVTLRLERTGRIVRAYCRGEESDWFTVGTVDLAMEGPWEVGIFAVGHVDRVVYPGTPAGGGALCFESLGLQHAHPSARWADAKKS